MCDIDKHRVVAWDEDGEITSWEFDTEKEATDKYDSLDVDNGEWYEVHQYAPGEEIDDDLDNYDPVLICGE